MSHGWRGLVCRSACKPHFHLPIFTFRVTQRALFFLLLTVLQQVVSGKLCRQNTWTKLGYSLVEFLLWRKASEFERQEEGKKSKAWIKQPSHLSYCDTVWGSCCMYRCSCKNFPEMLEEENSIFPPSYITHRHWCMALFEFCIMWEVWGATFRKRS